MRMPETMIDDSTRQHLCGFLVRIHAEVTGVTTVRKSASEIEVRHVGVRIRYQRLNDNEYLTHCPRCGEAFPKAVSDG